MEVFSLLSVVSVVLFIVYKTCTRPARVTVCPACGSKYVEIQILRRSCKRLMFCHTCCKQHIR